MSHSLNASIGFGSVVLALALLVCAVELGSVSAQNDDTAQYCYNETDFPSLPTLPGYSYVPNEKRGGVVYIHGDVRVVLEGQVPPGTEETFIDATGYVGLGAATVGVLEASGEVFFANNLAHVRSTDNSSEDYYKVVRGQQFRSPFAIFAVDGDAGDGVAIYQSQSPSDDSYTLIDFFTNVYDSMDTNPFCYYGLVKFAMMEGIAVSKAPIYNETIEDGGYYDQPPFKIANMEALIFGCAANYSTVEDPALVAQLQRCLYVTINDPIGNSSLLVHAHGLGAVPCLDAEDTQAGEQGGVYHFLTNSTITEIRTNVFKIDTVDRLVDFDTGTPKMLEKLVRKKMKKIWKKDKQIWKKIEPYIIPIILSTL